MPAAKRERPTITPPVYDLVRLVRGPMAGRKLRVLRGTELSFPTRPRRGKADRPPCAVYVGDSSTGKLRFVGTVGNKETLP